MEFLSSIKNAYDSIGSEITKTFDSSGSERDKQKPEKDKGENVLTDMDEEQFSPPKVILIPHSGTVV